MVGEHRSGHHDPQPWHVRLPRHHDEHAVRNHDDERHGHPHQREGHTPRVRPVQPGRAEGVMPVVLPMSYPFHPFFFGGGWDSDLLQ